MYLIIFNTTPAYLSHTCLYLLPFSPRFCLASSISSILHFSNQLKLTSQAHVTSFSLPYFFLTSIFFLPIHSRFVFSSSYLVDIHLCLYIIFSFSPPFHYLFPILDPLSSPASCSLSVYPFPRTNLTFLSYCSHSPMLPF